MPLCAQLRTPWGALGTPMRRTGDPHEEDGNLSCRVMSARGRGEGEEVPGAPVSQLPRVMTRNAASGLTAPPSGSQSSSSAGRRPAVTHITLWATVHGSPATAGSDAALLLTPGDGLSRLHPPHLRRPSRWPRTAALCSSVRLVQPE